MPVDVQIPQWLIPAGETAGSFLLNYLVHSTLLLAAALLATRLFRLRRPETRELLWKAALFGGIATSLMQSFVPLPHWGGEFMVATGDSAPTVRQADLRENAVWENAVREGEAREGEAPAEPPSWSDGWLVVERNHPPHELC